MGFESVSLGDKAETVYHTLKMPSNPKEGTKYELINQDEAFVGSYLNSFEREGMYGVNLNHVFVTDDNIHHVFPGSADIDKAIAGDDFVKGIKTEITYKGKKTFQRFDEKLGKKVPGTAHDWLLRVDRDSIVQFTDDKYNEKIVTGETTAATTAKQVADSIPF
jgi:hypothetical protein